jgi:sugar lactone lactonase YvrE
LTLKKTTAELLVNENAALAESPIWDHRYGRLVWADISKNIIWRTDISNGISEKQHLNQAIGCVAPHGKQGYVMAGGNGFFAINKLGEELTLINRAFDSHHQKFNDGKVDPQGRFWAGSACLDGTEVEGSLYSIDENHSVTTAFGGITSSNGFDWSADGRFFYYVDTAAGGIDVFDIDEETGAFIKRRRFVDIPGTLGLADGLTVDAEGCVWLAIWYAGGIFRYAPSGELIEKVNVPVCRTSSCVFGGDKMSTLFITTAKGREQSNFPTENEAGAIFAIETEAQGQVRSSYHG